MHLLVELDRRYLLKSHYIVLEFLQLFVILVVEYSYLDNVIHCQNYLLRMLGFYFLLKLLRLVLLEYNLLFLMLVHILFLGIFGNHQMTHLHLLFLAVGMSFLDSTLRYRFYLFYNFVLIFLFLF